MNGMTPTESQQKLGQALEILEAVYKNASGDLAQAIEEADSKLFDILAILKGIA